MKDAIADSITDSHWSQYKNWAQVIHITYSPDLSQWQPLQLDCLHGS